MRTYKYHPIAIRDILRRSARSDLFVAAFFSPVLIIMGLISILSKNWTILSIVLYFVLAGCVVQLMFLGLGWLDLHFTCFYLTEDSISRQQYGRINRRILRSKVTEIQKRHDGLMVMTKGQFLLVPNGLVGEDGFSCDVHARLVEWRSEK